MRLAAVRDEAAVVQRGPVEEPDPGRGLAVEVAPEPRLALREEVHDDAVGTGPAAAGRGGERHDHAAVGVDHDPEPAGPGRTAERVREVAAGQARDARPTRWRRRRGHERPGGGPGVNPTPSPCPAASITSATSASATAPRSPTATIRSPSPRRPHGARAPGPVDDGPTTDEQVEPHGQASYRGPLHARGSCVALAILPVRRGAIAQLGERLNGMQGVRGSSPRSSTNR